MNLDRGFLRNTLAYIYYIVSKIFPCYILFYKKYTILSVYFSSPERDYFLDKKIHIYIFDTGLNFHETLIPYTHIIKYGRSDEKYCCIELFAKIQRDEKKVKVVLDTKSILQIVLEMGEDPCDFCNTLKNNMYYSLKYH
jgi:hypothetical protein